MNTDRFRFRAWNNNQLWEPFSLLEPMEGWDHWPSDTILMQCTGLKDSEGTLIWESDIVEYEAKGNIYRLCVVFDESACFNLDGGIYNLFEVNEESKVIGNIYENPELLRES